MKNEQIIQTGQLPPDLLVPVDENPVSAALPVFHEGKEIWLYERTFCFLNFAANIQKVRHLAVQTQHILVPYLASSHHCATSGMEYRVYDSSHCGLCACLPTWCWGGGVALGPTLQLLPQEHSGLTWAEVRVNVEQADVTRWCFLPYHLGGEENWRRTQIPCSVASLLSHWLTLPTASWGFDSVTTTTLHGLTVTTLIRNNDVCLRNTYPKCL